MSGMSLSSKALLWSLLALGACLFAPRAFAADACSVGISVIDFGTYDPTSSTPLDGQGSVTVTCTGGNNLPVTIGVTTGGSNSFAQRRMTSGAEVLNYNLYTSSARSTILGTGTGGTSTVTCTVGLSSTDCAGSNPSGGTRVAVRTLYGRVTELQNVTGAGGQFTDTLTVNVTF
jgi:spore coat protein U-like protein